MKKLIKDSFLISTSMMAGAFVGIMLAPSNGKETRKKLMDYMKNVFKKEICEDESKSE